MSTQQTESFEAALAQRWPPALWHDVTCVVAVSGGPDSVALLRAVDRLRARIQTATGRLVVAHFNHRIRPAEADHDALFVENLACRLNLPFHVSAAARPATAGGDGLEAEARTQRYAFFRNVADSFGARFLVTGHTADDQVETVLHRIIRGTGIIGLGGIPVCRPLSELTNVVRPMLHLRRHDVRLYLDALHQPSCHDSSNTSTDLTRNRLRHELIPHICANYNASFPDALLRLRRHASDAAAVLDQLADELHVRCVTCVQPQIAELFQPPLLRQPGLLMRHMLVRLWQRQQWPLGDMNAAKWDCLRDFVVSTTTPAALSLPGPVHVRRRDQTITLHYRG